VSEEKAGNSAIFWLWDFAVAGRRALHSKNLVGAFQTDGVGCTLSADRELKTEIPICTSTKSTSRNRS
jgi:hypothetical protein